MAYYHHTCRRCGRTFDSRRSTGVSFLLKEKYCSRRCEAAAKKHDSEYYKGISKKSKISMIVGVILIILVLITTKNDKEKIGSQSAMKTSKTEEKKSEIFKKPRNLKTSINNDELKEDTFINPTKSPEQENKAVNFESLEKSEK